MRVLLDPSHHELSEVLDQLLEEDVDVTAREVARRHPTLKAVTAFTRNAARAQVIADAQRRQQEVRSVATTPHRKRAETLSEQLERRGEKVTELEGAVSALVASHVACVRAVMRHGGMPALERFWNDYKEIGEQVSSLGAIPEPAPVINFEQSRKRGPKSKT